MEGWIGQTASVWNQAIDIWLSGGWAMLGIAVIALVMFGLGIHVQLKLTGRGFTRVKEKTWRRWIDNPGERTGPIGDLLDFVMGNPALKDLVAAFEELQKTEIAPFQRDLKVMKICVSAAPLVGLLGTVTGMLATFAALSSGAGGDKTMAMIADGISEALITTETGLVMAIPGMFFHYQMTRKLEQYRAFLAHLESVCTQKHYRNMVNQHVSSNEKYMKNT